MFSPLRRAGVLNVIMVIPDVFLPSDVHEYCWQTFNASCPDDAVILMTSAHYGRMKMGRCLSRDYYVGT